MASYAFDDPDAGRLLAPPATTKRKRHQVRIQGRLVLVRSVSAVNLAPSATTPTSTDTPALPTATRLPPPPARHDPGVGQVVNSNKQNRRQQTNRQSTVPTTRRKSYGAQGDASDLIWDGEGHDGAVNTTTDTASETEEDEQETALRDRQRRGYGIGGAGNIRRPTEVVQFYSSSRTGAGMDRGRRRWQWMSSLFGLRGKKEDTNGGQDGGGTPGETEGSRVQDTSTHFESS